MRTIDEQAITGRSWWQGLGRDVRLLLRIAHMLYAYLVVGRRIRQAYRAREAQNEIFWVDEEMPR